MSTTHRVVIIGGGFGGLYAAQSLKRAKVDVTLIDRRNFHLFQPLLYQVASGGLSPANIAAPLRSILKRQRNARVLMAEVIGFDVAHRKVLLADGEIEFDTLIVAAGAKHNYFGRPEWEQFAPGLKTIEDATIMRSRILSAFEAAERETDPARLRALLTFAIVGAGPTGVELAGAIAEIARDTLRRDFRQFDPGIASVQLVDAVDRVLQQYAPELSAKATTQLARLGVTVRTGAMVKNIEAGRITLAIKSTQRDHLADSGSARSGSEVLIEIIEAHSIFWAAGVQASPLGRALADATGVKMDRVGRVLVEPDCTLNGHPETFVIGDLAVFTQDGKPLPGVAPVAMQQGKYVARVIKCRLSGTASGPFVYTDKGSMATIGRAAGVADIRGWKFSGYFAWLLWLFVHLMYLVQFHNRVLVFMQWAWNYFTRNRSARLITDHESKSGQH